MTRRLNAIIGDMRAIAPLMSWGSVDNRSRVIIARAMLTLALASVGLVLAMKIAGAPL